jgi:hypothetical protein
VRKLDPDDNPGPWSAGVQTFTVSGDGPVLEQAQVGPASVSNDLLFSWNPAPGTAPSSYLFESSATKAFSSTIERRATVMTAWAPTAAYPDRPEPYFWRVTALDGAGHVLGVSTPGEFVKDTAAPTVTTVTPKSGLAVDGTITVTFSENVRGVSVTGVVLQMADTATLAPLAGVVTPAADTSATTATFRPKAPLVAGQSYDLVVGAGITDVHGNAMTTTTTRIRTTTVIENTSPALVERWDSDTASAASGGRYLSAHTAGASATFTFTGSAVKLLGRTSNAGGHAHIYLDGVRQTATPVSFYTAAPVFRKAVFSKAGLARKAHTVELRVLGTRPAGSTAPAVDFDAYVIDGGAPFEAEKSTVKTRFARVATTNASGGSYTTLNQVAEPAADKAKAEYQFEAPQV